QRDAYSHPNPSYQHLAALLYFFRVFRVFRGFFFLTRACTAARRTCRVFLRRSVGELQLERLHESSVPRVRIATRSSPSNAFSASQQATETSSSAGGREGRLASPTRSRM